MYITVGEIIRLFIIMMQISIEPLEMGGYPSYFVEGPMIHLGRGYSVQLRGYDTWGIYVMTLIIFKQICIAFYPESRTSFCEYKCRQMR